DHEATGLTHSSSQDVIFGPATASQFVILDPSDSTVGIPTTVTVHALDGLGNIDTNYNTDVTLVCSGDATDCGVVDIQSGVGSLNLNNLTAHTVTLTLDDHEATGLTHSSSQDVV